MGKRQSTYYSEDTKYYCMNARLAKAEQAADGENEEDEDEDEDEESRELDAYSKADCCAAVKAGVGGLQHRPELECESEYFEGGYSLSRPDTRFGTVNPNLEATCRKIGKLAYEKFGGRVACQVRQLMQYSGGECRCQACDPTLDEDEDYQRWLYFGCHEQ